MAELLSEWGHTVNLSEIDSTRIVADGPSADLSRIRDFLDRLGLPYRVYPSTSDAGAQALADAGPDPVLPVLWYALPDGSGTLVRANPTNRELGDALSSPSGPVDPEIVRDLVVVGSGPAGLAACGSPSGPAPKRAGSGRHSSRAGRSPHSCRRPTRPTPRNHTRSSRTVSRCLPAAS